MVLIRAIGCGRVVFRLAGRYGFGRFSQFAYAFVEGGGEAIVEAILDRIYPIHKGASEMIEYGD